jgi:redox-sensitive bicupin YhaK (pirin superfamily)
VNELRPNELTILVSPDKDGAALWINQDAIFSMGDFDAGRSFTYDIGIPGNGAYIFLISGQIDVEGSTLNKRDAIGVYDTGSIPIETKSPSRVLILEVPMK